MKNYPEIYEAKFGYADGGKVDEKFTAADAAINSALLRAICELVEPKFSEAAGEFSAGRRWRVRLSDQHDDHDAEPYPHYVLDVGEGEQLEWDTDDSVSISIAYCDNHSTFHKGPFFESPVKFDIEQAPGRFTVTVMGGFGHCSLRRAAVNVCEAYIDALEKYLPDYFIIVDRSPLEA